MDIIRLYNTTLYDCININRRSTNNNNNNTKIDIIIEISGFKNANKWKNVRILNI